MNHVRTYEASISSTVSCITEDRTLGVSGKMYAKGVVATTIPLQNAPERIELRRVGLNKVHSFPGMDPESTNVTRIVTSKKKTANQRAL